jgi:hypothetical protein
MKKINNKVVQHYVELNIGNFHQKRIQSLDKLKLSDVIKRKNPYLYKAKNILTAEEFIKNITDAHISSNEETIFGDWLEGLAIYINEIAYSGRKSGIKNIDLEFDKDHIRYIVNIKSGPNWGNSSQIAKMVQDFKTAKKILRTSQSNLNVVAINGCCYGKDNIPDKGDYYKYCGQQFWHFISGEKNLYIDLIEPLGYEAKKRNDEFNISYSRMINLFTKDFISEYCNEKGDINWEKIVSYNSSSKTII